MFHTMLTHSDYEIPAEAEPTLLDFFRTRCRDKAFGNCREVRNLAERVKVYAANRLSTLQKLPPEVLRRLTLDDIQSACAEILDEYAGLSKNSARAIGFGE